MKNFIRGIVIAGTAVCGFAVFALLLGVGIAGGLAAACGMDTEDDVPEWESAPDKVWMYGGSGTNEAAEIAYIPIRGEIGPSDEGEALFGGGESCYAFALKSIRAATLDEDIEGIVLMLDTPGGTVTEADILANAVTRFRESRKGRFVIAHMGSLCCSGGYYIAAGADCIVAHPTTLTGSIGVIMNAYNAAELAKKAGVKSVTIASGNNKAMLDPLQDVNPEHVAILKRAVQHDYDRFVAIVAKGRHLPVKVVREIADGRVLSAHDAVEAKLVDAIGYAEDVWDKAADLADADDIRVYRYEEPFNFRSLFSPGQFARFGRAFFRGVKAEAGSSGLRSSYRLR